MALLQGHGTNFPPYQWPVIPGPAHPGCRLVPSPRSTPRRRCPSRCPAAALPPPGPASAHAPAADRCPQGCGAAATPRQAGGPSTPWVGVPIVSSHAPFSEKNADLPIKSSFRLCSDNIFIEESDPSIDNQTSVVSIPGTCWRGSPWFSPMLFRQRCNFFWE